MQVFVHHTFIVVYVLFVCVSAVPSVVTAGNVDGAVHTQLHTSSTVDTAAAGSHRVVEFYAFVIQCFMQQLAYCPEQSRRMQCWWDACRHCTAFRFRIN